MRIIMFYHSLVSDWNHGNAHFLRGVVSELVERGHDVRVLEPRDSWSRRNLLEHVGAFAIDSFHQAYPGLSSARYQEDTDDLDALLDGADLVIVHEWNTRSLVARIGRNRRRSGGYVALFHDTHHRSATAPEEMRAYDLEHYDGVLAFGEVIRQRYLAQGWSRRAFVWHEGADTRIFRPLPDVEPQRDLVWIGNWGDGERAAELHEFLLGPIMALGLSATIHGVRYPEHVRHELRVAGIREGGWLPNYEVPAVFARHRATVHVPRRPYVEALLGIPTIRVFEALACGIPLVSAPWRDDEQLFSPGEDFLVARDGEQMQQHLRTLLADPSMARELTRHGLATIRARHTCAHRVDELLRIVAGLQSRERSEDVVTPEVSA